MKSILPVISILLIMAGCASKPNQNESVIANATNIQSSPEFAPSTQTLTQIPTQTATLTKFPPSATPIIPPLATLNAEATLGASFGNLCDEFETDSSRYAEISPDGNWISISCGYKINQTLIVQNQSGVKWVFGLTDFLDSSHKDSSGIFSPLAWSSDNRFLYFTMALGEPSGDFNLCFPNHGYYGLYRLNLETGTLVTLIPSNGRFPGNEIRFSPTNDYYAINKDGLLITNLISGKEIKIDNINVMEMSWSPDGKLLAFSVATCTETFLESSSILVWNSSTNQTQVIFSTKEMLLTPQLWIDNEKLGFKGEKWIDNNYLSTIFEYDLKEGAMVFSGTATPRP